MILGVEIGISLVAGVFIGVGVVFCLMWILFVILDFISRWRYPYASTCSGIPEWVEKFLGIPQRRLVIPLRNDGKRKIV